jgi:opacity protein-like surface antigen
MKKFIKLSSIAILSLLSNTLTAQQNEGGFYVSLATGYAFGSSTGESIPIQNSTETSEDVSKNEVVSYSLGKGINFGGTIGYMFDKNIGAEVGINYLKGAKTVGLDTRLNGERVENSIAATMLQINPKLVLALDYEKINPYAKFGLIVGISPSVETTEDKTEITDELPVKNLSVREFYGGQAFGFNAALGLMINLNANFGLFGELNLNNLSYSPSDSTLRKSTIDGIDNLPNLTENEKNFKYLKEYTSSTTDETNILPKFTLPFGSIALNIGAKYSF